MQSAETAHSYDLDDTIFNRGNLVRLGGLMKERVSPHRVLLPSASDISRFSREPNKDPIPFKDVRQRTSLALHGARRLLPGVEAALPSAAAEGIAIYGNTGRSNSESWIEMTEASLATNGIDHYFYRGIFYKPDGVSTALSKAEALLQLREMHSSVSHFDDDPRTVFSLARIFPDMTFYLVHHGVTGLIYSDSEYDEYPNVHRVNMIAEVL